MRTDYWMTVICGNLKNWFIRKPDGTDVPKVKGTFTIASGVITGDGLSLVDGQYYGIRGSIFNDGIHEFESVPTEPYLKDETFKGEVQPMLVPIDVVEAAKKAADLESKQGDISLLQSENISANSYSYSMKSADEIVKTQVQSLIMPGLSRYQKL